MLMGQRQCGQLGALRGQYHLVMADVRPTRDEVVDSTAETEANMRPQSVPVNVYETSAALVILAPLPAVTAEDVTVEVRPGTLRFWAHLRSAGRREYLIHEWEYGGYEREIELPNGFGRSVEATLTNGQIAIRVLRGDVTEVSSIHPDTA
jgi:HSP20 family protein